MAETDLEPSFDDRFLNNLPDYVTATPVEDDPFERAAQRVRAPYEKANQRESGLPQVLDYYGNKIKSALTAPQDAYTGQMQVSDPETGMPTQEAMGRAGDVAGLTSIGSPFAVKGALGSAGGKLMQMENKSAAPPFYSALEHAVENTKQQKMPADQWLGTISNSKGVKPEELDWTGFKDFLAEKGKQPVTKAEVQEHLNNNKVELKEIGKADINDPLVKYFKESGLQIKEIQNSKDIADARRFNANFRETTKGLSDEEVLRAARKTEEYDKMGDTKYSQYQLPGGENYREMLITMPDNKFNSWYNKSWNPRGDTPFESLPQYTKNDVLKSYKEDTGVDLPQSYKSSHWDEPNILAHVRMNDRNIEGKKSLHLEEIQSDWHQQGREKGYKQNLIGEEKQKWEELRNNLRYNPNDFKALEEFNKLEDKRLAGNPKGVPDAPFKKTWHELALKRMVREAAEKGYDRLSWTPGEANRTNPKNLGQTGESAERADRGLKKFYDEIIPQSLEKIGKEHGVKVKTADVPIDSTPRSLAYFLEWGEKNHPRYKRSELGKMWANGANDPIVQQFMKDTKPQKLHYIDIPESLKNVATQKGFPLFSSGLPVTFTPVEGDPHKSANTVGDAIDTAAKKYGINPTVLKGIASIESSWDPGSNRNKATQYKGLFQIGKEEWKQHGTGDIYNAKDNANAAAKMLSEHAQWFKDNYGREPTPGEFYMMHQQGRGFISNGTMTNIGGNPYPGMRGPQTPETFKQGWSDTLARKMAQFGGADSISDGTERPSSNVKVANNSPTPTHKFTPVDFNPFDLVNHANHVPYGAGASDTPSGYPVNIDKRIPQHNDELKLPDGEPADLHKYLTIHEIEEYKAMKNGVPYHTAHHDIATPMEKKAVESDGVDWKKYTHIMDGYLKKTEEEGYKNLPKGLYTKPYHSRSLIKPEPKKDNEK